MRVVFVRHGARRGNDLDPPLTSAGHRMAAETGEWLAFHQVMPDHCLVTPTARTRETADNLLAQVPHVRQQVVPSLPESLGEWSSLVRTWGPRIGDHGVLLLVGHHPSLSFLLQAFGPPPEPVPLGNFAACVVVDPIFTGAWVISAAWPGRAG